MSQIEPLVLGAAIAAALLLGLAFWRTRSGGLVALAGSMCAAGAVGNLLWSLPSSVAWPGPARVILAMVCLSPPFFLWLLARMVCEDQFTLRPRHWAYLAGSEAAGMALFFSYDLLLRAHVSGLDLWRLGILARTPASLLVAAALWTVVKDRLAARAGDLLAARARLRLAVTFASSGIALILMVDALFVPAPDQGFGWRIATQALILLASLGGCVLLLRLDGALGPKAAAAKVGPDRLPAAPRHRVEPAPDPDVPALARLDVLMNREQVWRETGLTIGALASRVGVPEHRLRRLINGRLGYRNFPAFLNAHRLAAAAARLSDRREAKTSVISIALDLGWASLGPFNRAFRAQFGMTPSDFRRNCDAAGLDDAEAQGGVNFRIGAVSREIGGTRPMT